MTVYILVFNYYILINYVNNLTINKYGLFIHNYEVFIKQQLINITVCQ